MPIAMKATGVRPVAFFLRSRGGLLHLLRWRCTSYAQLL